MIAVSALDDGVISEMAPYGTSGGSILEGSAHVTHATHRFEKWCSDKKQSQSEGVRTSTRGHSARR